MIVAYRPSRYRGGRRAIVGAAFVSVWVGVVSSAAPAPPPGVVNPLQWWIRMPISVYSKGVAISPSDSANLAGGLTAAIYIGGAGVVAVVFEDGSVVNFTCVAGEILPVRAMRVNLTNTTATLMNALYSL